MASAYIVEAEWGRLILGVVEVSPYPCCRRSERRRWSARLDLATPMVSATAFSGNPPVAATASGRRAFWAGLFEGLAQDLSLHRRAA